MPVPALQHTRTWVDAWMKATGDRKNEVGENESNNGDRD